MTLLFLYSRELLMKLCRLLTRYITIQQSTPRRHLATYFRKTPPVGTLSIRRVHLRFWHGPSVEGPVHPKTNTTHIGPELPFVI